MRGTVVIHLVVLPDPFRKESVEGRHHVLAEPGIGVLVDDHGGGGVANEHRADPLFQSRSRHDIGDLTRDVHHLF
jgi:hypothetical protein